MRLEPQIDRLIGVAALIGALQHLGIAPQLRLGDAAAARRRCRRPARSFLPDLTVDPTRQVAELPRRGAADDDLGRARREHPAFGDVQLAAGPGARSASGPRSGTLASVPLRFSGWPTITNSSGEAWTPSGAALDAGRFGDQPRFFAGEAAGHLGIAAGPHHDHGARIAGALHRGSESLGDRQHRDEHDDHAADADDRHDRRARGAARIDRRVTPVTAMV